MDNYFQLNKNAGDIDEVLSELIDLKDGEKGFVKLEVGEDEKLHYNIGEIELPEGEFVRYDTGNQELTNSEKLNVLSNISGAGLNVDGIEQTWNNETFSGGEGAEAFNYSISTEGIVQQKNFAEGDYSHAEGEGSYAEGKGSHAENQSRTIGEYSHSEGSGRTGIIFSFLGITATRPVDATVIIINEETEEETTQTMSGTESIGKYVQVREQETQYYWTGITWEVMPENFSSPGSLAHAEGQGIAYGNASHAENLSHAIAPYSHSEGQGKAYGATSHAEGTSNAYGMRSHAEGNESRAEGENSHAEGNQTIATEQSSHAEGIQTAARGEGAHAEGENSVANRSASHAEGRNTLATLKGPQYDTLQSAPRGATVTLSDGTQRTFTKNEKGSIVVYNGNYYFFTNRSSNYWQSFVPSSLTMVGSANHAEGIGTIAIGSPSHAEGEDTVAEGEFSHAEGLAAKAEGLASHAEGKATSANGDYSHSEGMSTIAGARAGSNIFSFGEVPTSKNVLLSNGTTKSFSDTDRGAVGSYQGKHYLFTNGSGGETWHIFSPTTGIMTTSSNHAEGNNTIAIGFAAHSEGIYTITEGDYSHAEGQSNKIIWTGTGDPPSSSHVEGRNNQVSLKDSHAEGYNNQILPSYSNPIGTVSVMPVNATITINGEQITLTADDKGKYVYFQSARYTWTGSKWVNGYDSSNDGYGHVEGSNNILFGGSGHVEGQGNIVIGLYAHSEGASNQALNSYTHTEGNYTTAYGSACHAEGIYTSCGDAFILGTVATKPSSSSITLTTGVAYTLRQQDAGKTVKCSADSHYYIWRGNSWLDYATSSPSASNVGHAEGYYSFLNNSYGHVEGQYSNSLGQASHAEGSYTTAKGSSSHAEGYNTRADGSYAHAEGYQTQANVQSSHAEGQSTTANGMYSHAEGYQTMTSDYYAHSEGWQTSAMGQAAHAEGKYGVASGDSSHKEGYSGTATAYSAHVEGYSCDATARASHAEGEDTLASGSYSHAEGYMSQATKLATHAEGYRTQATGQYAHSEGYMTEATNYYAHAEGNLCKAEASAAHAEGYNTTATEQSSHSEGQQTEASGFCSHAEGYSTKATGRATHSEGNLTEAIADNSHAEGLGTIASGENSHASGNYTIAKQDSQFVCGAFNREDINQEYAFIVGNGATTSSDPEDGLRRNLLALNNDGHIELNERQQTFVEALTETDYIEKYQEGMLDSDVYYLIQREREVATPTLDNILIESLFEGVNS